MNLNIHLHFEVINNYHSEYFNLILNNKNKFWGKKKKKKTVLK